MAIILKKSVDLTFFYSQCSGQGCQNRFTESKSQQSLHPSLKFIKVSDLLKVNLSQFQRLRRSKQKMTDFLQISRQDVKIAKICSQKNDSSLVRNVNKTKFRQKVTACGHFLNKNRLFFFSLQWKNSQRGRLSMEFFTCKIYQQL